MIRGRVSGGSGAAMDDVGLEAERRVLHAILASAGRAIDDLSLAPSDFHFIEHERVYQTMLTMHRSGQSVEPLALSERLPDDSVLIFSLGGAYGAPVSVDHYASIILNRAVRRRLADLGASMQQFDAGMTADDLVEYVRDGLDRVSRTSAREVQSISDLWDASIADASADQRFLPSPWPSLDEAIGGFAPGGLYIFAARPGIGKTVVAVQIAMHLGIRDGAVAFSSLEMSREQITRRGIALAAEVNLERMERGKLTQAEHHEVARARDKLPTISVFVDDQSGVGPMHIRSFARQVSRRGTLRAICIDYLQLMEAPRSRDESRQEVVSGFSRQLKKLARDFEVPVIALSQLNRDSEKRKDRKPMLSELRESGSLEQDADVVVLMSRNDGSNDIHFDVAKNRHGPQSLVTLQWRGDIAKVDDYKLFEREALI